MRGQVAVTGVGYSEVGRDLGYTEGQLTVAAARAALDDAGLGPEDIDGMTMFPHRKTPPDPFDGPDLSYVQRSLGLPNLNWWQPTASGNGQLGSVILAIHALLAGECNHVMCYRAHLAQRSRSIIGGSDRTKAWDEQAYTLPYGGGGGAVRSALWGARHMYKYGTTQEQLGLVCVNSRAYAATNPRAYWRQPLTLDEYFASRWVATPLKLFDCDYPVDGATVLILSRADAARQTRKPVYVESAGTGPGPCTSHLTWPEKSYGASKYAAERMWLRTKLRPPDVDVAQLYDGFSFLTLFWLEDLGFVPKGEGGRFFQDGGGRPGSALPINTDGGQLGMGRLHGFGKVGEAAQQLRGEAANQVDDPEVAVACAGGGPNCTCLLLTREVVR